MRKLRLSLLLCLFVPFLNAQKIRCASDIKIVQNKVLHDKISGEITKMQFRRAAVEQKIIRIPIVVHVIHNNIQGTVGGPNNNNISNEQILSQIEVLNEDFRRKKDTPGFNSSPVGADMQIEFFLANIDPNGQATTGINRVYNGKNSYNIFSDRQLLSNLASWDASKYLNIWVTRISGGYLGNAEFPIATFDGLEATDIDEKLDGVLIDFRAFGRIGEVLESPYHFGRTTTHEVGHWLGLLHIWGDTRCGTDYCDDTPTAQGPNLNLGCVDVYSFCQSDTTRNMIENFLDYSIDSCMNIFTQDQKSRVRAILELSKRRKALLENADIFQEIKEPLQVRILGNPSEEENLNFKIFVDRAKELRVELIDLTGRILFSEIYAHSRSRILSIPKRQLARGVLLLKIKAGDVYFEKRIVSI